MDRISNNHRCFWNHYPNHDPVWMCTLDKLDWFEKVDLKRGVWESGLCIAGMIGGQPATCISYAKWFADSLDDILK